MRIPRVSDIAPGDLAFYSFQKRFSACELRAPELDNANRRRLGLPQQHIVLDGFAAEREGRPDSFQGEWKRWIEGK